MGGKADLLGGPGEEADEEDAPGHDVLVREADALQGDAGLDRPALVVDRALAVPDGVEARLEVALDVDHAVALDAQGIDDEGEGALAVVEGVDVDEGQVVLEDVVALADGGLDLGRLVVETAEGEVEVLGVVGDVGLRALGGFLAVIRLEGLEAVELEPGGPGGIVEDAVDDGRHGGPGEDRGGLFGLGGRRPGPGGGQGLDEGQGGDDDDDRGEGALGSTQVRLRYLR